MSLRDRRGSNQQIINIARQQSGSREITGIPPKNELKFNSRKGSEMEQNNYQRKNSRYDMDTINMS